MSALTLDEIISTLEPIRELGLHVIDVNFHYEAGIARQIRATGKPVESMTVGELLQLCREHHKWLNDIHSGSTS